MNDLKKSKEQLLSELKDLRRQLAVLMKSEADFQKMKSALLESENKYRILFESSRDAIMLLEPPDWLFTGANAATIEMFRASDVNEFISVSPWVISPEYQPDGQLSSVKAIKMIEKAMKEGTNFFEWTHKRFNGEEFIASVLLTKVNLKDKSFVVATVRDITERKKTEEELTKHRNLLSEMVKEQTLELRKSELQFRTLSDNIPGVVYLCNNDEKYSMIYINDAVEKVTGYKKEEFLNDKINFIELYHPDDVDNIFNKVDEAVRNHLPFHLNYRIRHKNGQWCYIEEFGTGVYQGDELQYLEGFLHDVTARVKSEERLRNILENSTNLFYSHTPDHMLTYLSPQSKQIMGYEPEEAMVKWTELVSDHPLNKLGFERTVKAIETGVPQTPYELEIIHKSGKKVWVEVHEAPVVENGKTTSIVGALTDITERKRAEFVRQVLFNISNSATTSSNLNELIRYIRGQLGELIDTTNFFIALYDAGTDSITLQYIADQSEKLTVFPAGKTLTAHVIRTQKPLLATSEVMNRLVESGDIELIGELSKVWLGVPLKVEGKVTGVLAVQSYTDENAYKQSDLEMLEFVSDQISVSIRRKKAEEDLKSALEKAKESDRLKSVFLGTMSHEFRTPLNTVIGFSDIIDKDTPKEEILDFVKTINESGKQLLSLVEDIFDISLIETGEIKILKEEFLIGPFMQNLRNFLKKEQSNVGKKNIQIRYIHPEDDKNLMIFTDGRKLNQILINLMKNALKFTNEGCIEYGYSPAIVNMQSMLKFYVKDTGIGISKDKQEYIFDIFRQGDDTYTRRYDGVGIGLSVSKKLTELLGGKMWLESEVGKGSCFYFTLPH